jgi:hypothetical protein
MTAAGSSGAIAPATPNCDRFHFADFTRENYRRLLRLARDRYAFRLFTDFDREEQFVLWRHDVDFSPQGAARMARIEAEEGVRATYLLHLHSDFYNLLEADVGARIAEIIDCGHAIGLHFDSHYYGVGSEEQLEDLLAFERGILEKLFGVPVEVFSFHVSTPFTMRCDAWSYGGMVHVHAAYFQESVGYCSDSNGYWRHRRLEEVLTSGTDERLQVLTHPEWWTDEVTSPTERIRRCADGRAASSIRRLEEVMSAHDRLNIDW